MLRCFDNNTYYFGNTPEYTEDINKHCKDMTLHPYFIIKNVMLLDNLIYAIKESEI